MEHLWAPWRNSYVTADKKNTDTLFFDIGQSTADRENLVVCRSKSAYVVLNRFPYNGGHSLVVPYRTVAEPSELAPDEATDLWSLVNRTVQALRQCYQPAGFNIGLNLGVAAGAGLPNHMHVHVVPRWSGDTNFMATTAGVRVHPNDLSKIYTDLKQAFDGPSV